MPETRTNKGTEENRATPDSKRPIQRANRAESDAIAERIKSVIGDESVSSFARRSGISEAVIRSYVSDGRMPSLDKAASIANAGSVTVDWLATGRLPKTRGELRALQATFQPGVVVGGLMAEAIRDGKPFSIDQQRALADDDTFCAYLSGSRLAPPEFLLGFAEMTGCAVGPLLSAYDLAKTQASISELEAQLADNNESALVKTYRAASESGKTALNKVAAAIRQQTMSAWFAAGMAVSEAANVFDKKK